MAKRSRRKTEEAEVEGEGSELDSTLAMTRERYGDIVERGNKRKQPNRIASGIFMLDFALMGGIFESRINHFVGEKSAGKSTVMQKCVAGAQNDYPEDRVVIMDIEDTYDPVWAEKCGVDNERVELVRPSTGEMAIDIADAVIDSQGCSMLVMDSLAFMIPMKEADASAEDEHMGRQARMFNELCRKTQNTMNRAKLRGHCPTVIWINQYRTNIGTMFGDNRTIPGGRAVEAAANLMISFRNKEHTDKDDDGVEEVDYNEHEFTISKNKVCNGPRHGAFRLMRGDDDELNLMEGDVDNATTMIVYAKKFGFWSGAGKNQKLEFDDVSLKFSRQNDAIRTLNEDPDLYWHLYYALIRQQAIKRRMPADFIERFDP